ncbi:MAG: oligosaccharide flippase family protein [Candidatus Marinimicrobia bacterium]|nr:oligosaccharide flippase family protein [candidate division WOR-3 bacterium]MCK4445849.1 oligosaccharide flippase family protein [Candidatus Neomarinimicrobiota bacterium]
MKDLIKTTTAISGTEIALMVVAIIRNKYLAVNIGPEGFGIYGLIQSFFSLASIFSGAWLAGGVTKFTSEYNKKNDNIAVQKIASLSIVLTAVLSLVITFAFIVAQKPMRKIFLSEEVLSIYFILFAASFLGTSLRPVFIALLQGLKQVKSVVAFRIIVSLADVIFVIILVYFFDLIGFFFSILATSLVAILIMWKQFNKHVGKFSFPSFHENITNSLLFFGGSCFFLSMLTFGGQYFLRFIVVKNINIASVGLLQAATGIMKYLGIFNRGAVFHFYPEISEEMSSSDRTGKINDYLRFILLINIPITVIAILFGKQILLLLYSSKFLPLSDLLFWFFLVHLMSCIAGTFHSNLMGMGLVKNFTLFGVLGTFLLLVVPTLFIKKYGLASVAIGYLLSYTGTIPLFYWHLKRRINFKFSHKIYYLLFIATLTISISITFMNHNLLFRIICGVVTLLLIGLMVQKEEYSKLLVLVKNKVKGKRHE